MPSRFSYSAFLWVLIRYTFFQGAAAASCDYSGQSYVIASQSDADSLKDCTTVVGDISVNVTSDVTDITLNGVQNLTGTLNLNSGSRLNTFVATDLVVIGDTLNIYYGPLNLTFSSLTTIGELGVMDDGRMVALNFPAGLSSWSTTPGNVGVVGTGLKILEGLQFPSINIVWIADNAGLHNLSIDAKTIGNDTQAQNLFLYDNGGGYFDLEFPSLTNGYGRFDLWNLTKLEMPKFHDFNGTFTIKGVNSSSLYFPALQTLGAYWVEGVGFQWTSSLTIEDSQLDNVNFPALMNVSGELTFTNNKGSLYNNLALPSLENASFISLEAGGSSWPGLNCTSLEGFLCNGTVAEIKCLNESFYNDTACSSSSGHNSVGYNTLLSSVLISLVGAALVAGLL